MRKWIYYCGSWASLIGCLLVASGLESYTGWAMAGCFVGALVLLALFGRFYRHDRAVYISVIVCTLLAALYDLICALPEGLYDALHADAVQAFGLRVLPFAGAGLGWICPLALGFVIGLAVHLMQKFRTK